LKAGAFGRIEYGLGLVEAERLRFAAGPPLGHLAQVDDVSPDLASDLSVSDSSAEYGAVDY